jgi:hypothetical protein
MSSSLLHGHFLTPKGGPDSNTSIVTPARPMIFLGKQFNGGVELLII